MSANIIACPLCKDRKNVFTQNVLGKHLRVAHPGKCFAIPCEYHLRSNKSTNVSSFMKHLTLHFSVASSTSKKQIVPSNPIEIQSLPVNESVAPLDVQFDIELLKNANIKNGPIILKKQLKNIKSEIDIDLDEVSRDVDILIARLYANKFLVRCSVQPLIKDFSHVL